MRKNGAWPKLGLWGVITLTFVWILVMNLFVDYAISRDYLDQPLLVGATILALMYTVWQAKLVVYFLNSKFKTKQK